MLGWDGSICEVVWFWIIDWNVEVKYYREM